MKIDVGIIGAMDSEIAELVAKLENKKEEIHGSVRFFVGELFGKKVAVTKCGVGKVYAAIAAEAMIISYSPRLLVNTGVGGALAAELCTSDVVIADKLVQHDMDTSGLGDPKGLISGINLIYFETDKRAVDVLIAAASKSGVKALVGTVATGDKFIAAREDKERIVSEFSASACEICEQMLSSSRLSASLPKSSRTCQAISLILFHSGNQTPPATV